jgi:diguanylate cyclase (GGDEF)-like protein/PAS domain S-box-containing protein
MTETTRADPTEGPVGEPYSWSVDRWVLSSLPVGVVVHSGDGRIMRCNAAAERILGLTESQMMGLTSMTPSWQALHEDETPFPGESHPAMVALRTGDRVDDVVMGIAMPDDSRTWIQVSAVPIAVDPEPSAPAVIATFADISEQMRLKTIATDAEEHYRLLAEHASDVVARATADGTITWVSPSVTSLLGWMPAELTGRSVFELLHPEDLGVVVAAQTRLSSGAAVNHEGRVRTASGGYRWVASHVQPVLDSSGAVIGRIAGWRDIEAERDARLAQAAAENRFRLFAENASDVVLAIGADRLVLWVSPAVTDSLGYSPEDLVGTELADLVHPDDLSSTAEVRAVVLARMPVETPPGGWILRLRSASGAYRWMAAKLTVLDASLGTRVAMVVGLTIVDELVSARRRAEQDEERLSATLDSLLDPHIVLEAVRDDTDRIVDFLYAQANAAACRFLGMASGELRGSRVLESDAGRAAEDLLAAAAHVIVSGEPLVRDDYEYDGPDGRRRYDIRAVNVGDALSFTWRDVTARYEADQRLASSEEHYRLLAMNVGDVVTQSLDGVFQWVSPSLTRILGWHPHDWVGHRLEEFVDPDDAEALGRARVDILAGEHPVLTLRVRAVDGRLHWVQIVGGSMSGGGGSGAAIVASIRLVDDQVALEKELDHRATHDALTDVLNRDEVYSRLSRMLGHDRRAGGRLAVVYADLDNLKEINDGHGHGAGDEALRNLASRFRGLVRTDDLVARVGGDEFLVVLDGVRDLADAGALAMRMVESARLPVPLWGGSFTMTLSVGVTLAEHGETVDQVVSRADRAMYDAKQRGRDQVVST